MIVKVNSEDVSEVDYDKGLEVLRGVPADTTVYLVLRVPEGYTTRLETTFTEDGSPRTVRITENRRKTGKVNKASPEKPPLIENSGSSPTLGRVSMSQENEINLSRNILALKDCAPKPKDSGLSPALKENSVGNRPLTLSPSKECRASFSSPSRRPLRLRNIITGHMTVECLHNKASEPVQCTNSVCTGSLMSAPPRRTPGNPRLKEEVLTEAKEFFDQYYTNIKRFNSLGHQRRWAEVVDEIEQRGTYHLRETELVYGAKLAWRNAPRCIGRIQWSKLQVFDARNVTTAREMFDALCNHIKYATNKGNIRSAITIFPQRTDGKHEFRIWNPQLIQYAGYRQTDGSVIGDPLNVEFTEFCEKLGWKGPRGRWDILPLMLSANGHDPQLFQIPEELILRVPIIHPKYSWFKELDLQWYALPAVSNMLFDAGGIEFPATPFNGWYMVTEIATRDLCDTHRFNALEDVATRMGLDTRAPSTLWKDRAVVEINFAVLYSFQKVNATIVDHHTASESFMKHWENEHRLRGGCPADWVWIVPPMSGSLTPVFHQEMLYYTLKPSYEYQEPPWKTHIWEKDRVIAGNGPRTPSRKFRFKEVAKAVKFTSNLFGKALSQRVKANVLYATETGKSENYAKTIGETFSHAFNVNVMCMSDYDIINLEHETLLLIVTSTFGNGDPPENGEVFARNLQAIKVTGDTTPDIECIGTTAWPFVRMNSAPADSGEETSIDSPTPTLDADIGPLSNVRFAVFALGSSAYPNFCSFGKYIDLLLGELGGERILKMGIGDELCGQEQSFRMWAQDVFQVACDVFCVGDDVSLSDVRATLHSDANWSSDKVRLTKTSTPTDICKGVGRGTNRKVSGCFLSSRVVLQSETEKQTILVELDTREEQDLLYFPGDHVGIYPSNRKEIVDGILKHILTTCPDPDQNVQLEIRKDIQTFEGLKEKWIPHDRLPPCSVRTALTRYFDITTPPGQQLLKTFSTIATDEEDRRKLELLATDSSRYDDWRTVLYPNLLEVLQEFPSVLPTPSLLLTQLPSLQPRFYSISSASDHHPGHIHVTVAVVTYRTQNGKGPIHYGVSSNYLASAPVGSEVPCFVRSAPNFRLPDNKMVPIIMVGPGTGIAPFRSFWQQRYLDKTKSTPFERQNFGHMVLFVGCRKPSVELYHEETLQMKQEGVLSEVYTAYSRLPDKPKRYVQHALREVAQSVYQQIVLERGHFYVCGDVSMAEDVNKTLKAIFQECGSMSKEAVDSFMIMLQEENRYHEDIFGITLRTAEVTNRGRAEARNRHSTSSS